MIEISQAVESVFHVQPDLKSTKAQVEAEELEADDDEEEEKDEERDETEPDSSVSLVEREVLDAVYHVLSIIRRSTDWLWEVLLWPVVQV